MIDPDQPPRHPAADLEYLFNEETKTLTVQPKPDETPAPAADEESV